MAKIGKHDPEAELTWIDRDNFVDDSGQWWHVIAEMKTGRLKAVCYFVDEHGDIREGRWMTTRMAAESRPKWQRI